MRGTGWKAITVVLVCAALFRAWGAFDYQGYAGDEGIIITAAKSVSAYGTTDWKNPQLCFFIIAGAMELFGDNPVGWRITGIVLGTASVLLLYLIARSLYPSSSVPLMAAALLAFDPFDIHFCRTALMEPIAVFFFLLFLLLILEYTENNRNSLTASGIALGCAIAVKAYFLFAIAVVIAYAFYRRFQPGRGNILTLGSEFTVKLLLLPLTIYLLTFFQWFGRGYDLPDLFRLRYDAYWIYNNNYRFYFEDILASGGRPWEWFLKLFSFGHQFYFDGQYGRFSIEINNPLFRILVLPAMGIVLFNALKNRRLQDLLAPLLFVACYILFFIAKRPFNSYSALPLLPFAYLALASAVTFIAQRYGREQEVSILFLSIIVISGLYLFPLIAGFQVPVDLYRSILSVTNLSKV